MMKTTSIARQYLQQTLDAVREVERNDEAELEAWLDAHGRHRTCIDVARSRGLVAWEELDAWLDCASHATPDDLRRSPLEVLLGDEAPRLATSSKIESLDRQRPARVSAKAPAGLSVGSRVEYSAVLGNDHWQPGTVAGEAFRLGHGEWVVNVELDGGRMIYAACLDALRPEQARAAS